jgi:hypothetical protein
MSIPRSTRAIVATATVAVLSACSGGSQFSPAGSQLGSQSQSQQATTPQIPSIGALSEDAKSKKPVPLIFVSDSGSRVQAGAVYAYTDTGTNQAPVWTLNASPLKYPNGLWVDGSDNLYVSDISGNVYEYDKPTASGPPTLSFTYSDAGYTPNHLAVCGDYLYASDLTDPSGGGAITVWKLGTSKPLRYVTQETYSEGVGDGISCNSKTGDVYFGYDTSYAGPGQVDQYAAGLTGNPTTLHTSPNYLAGLTFNKTYATFVVGDAYNGKGPAIEFWKPTGGAPVHSLFGSWISSPTGFAYESTDKYLWDADEGTASVNKFLPSKGTVENTITNAGNGKKLAVPNDVAVSPPDHS